MIGQKKWANYGLTSQKSKCKWLWTEEGLNLGPRCHAIPRAWGLCFQRCCSSALHCPHCPRSCGPSPGAPTRQHTPSRAQASRCLRGVSLPCSALWPLPLWPLSGLSCGDDVHVRKERWEPGSVRLPCSVHGAAAALPRPVCPQDRPSVPQPVPLVRSGPATRPRPPTTSHVLLVFASDSAFDANTGVVCVCHDVLSAAAGAAECPLENQHVCFNLHVAGALVLPMHRGNRRLQPGWFRPLSPGPLWVLNSSEPPEEWGVAAGSGVPWGCRRPRHRSPCARLVWSRALLRVWRPAQVVGVLTGSEAAGPWALAAGWAVWGFWGSEGRGTIQHGGRCPGMGIQALAA